MTNMKKWNNVIAVVVALLGAAVIALNSKFPITLGEGDPGAGFWPILLGAILILTAFLLFVNNFRHGEREAAKTFTISKPANMLVYKFMALTVLFCVLMCVIGLLGAALVFLPVAMYMLGARNKKLILAIDVLFVLVLYIVFMRLLHTPLPLPFWMD